LLREQTVPAVAAPIRFGKGIEFIGLTPSRRRAAPGESLEVVYYWKCPPGVRVADVVAFVHWERGHDRFHDDHALLEEVSRGDLDYQPFPEIFTETRAVTVPEGMPAGEYRLVTGLYNRMDGRRLRPRTSLSRRRRAVACPLVFEVVARPEA
jgi:hypothetical protein